MATRAKTRIKNQARLGLRRRPAAFARAVGRIQWRRRERRAASLRGPSLTTLDLQFKEKVLGFRFPLHSHAREFELYVVHRGRVDLVLAGGSRRSLRRRDMVLIPPGMAHGAAGDPTHVTDVITAHFRSPDLLKRAPELAGFLGRPRACGPEASRALAALCSLAWRRNPAPAWRLAASLRAFLALLADEAAVERLPGPAAPAAPGLLARLEEQALARPERRLGLAEAARMLGCSVSELTHLAGRTGGPTPQGVMLRARLEAAKRLLRETGLPIKDIAGRVGFATQASFGRAFLRVEGRPPGEYRRGLVFAPRQGKGQEPA